MQGNTSLSILKVKHSSRQAELNDKPKTAQQISKFLFRYQEVVLNQRHENSCHSVNLLFIILNMEGLFFFHSCTMHPDIIKFFIYPTECTTRLL